MTYRTFYQYASQLTLLKLYLAHVRPLLEYASELRDPHQKVLVDSLERVQKFGLRMSCKQWRSDYESLLVWADLPSLKTRRSKAKLCYLNVVLCTHLFLCQNPGIWTLGFEVFKIPHSSSHLHARTNSYKFSFYPDSIGLMHYY